MVKGLIMKLFPNVKEDQIGVFLNTDAAVEDQETPMRGEDQEDELLSNCCDAPPTDEVVDGIGRCSACGEGAAFSPEGSMKDAEEPITESYTSQYLTEQASKDERNQKPVTESVSFKERYKPKTSWQLEELRRYGL